MITICKRRSLVATIAILLTLGVCAQHKKSDEIQPGAHQTSLYLPLLKGKRVGIFANHTSTVGKEHLVDVLRKNGVNITVIFGPEHGFRGTADAGEKIGNYVDQQTGIPVISLYGSKRKPSKEDLENVDILIFDIQDVGVRFYTYISSLEEFMESAFLNNKSLLLFDRPNPNGFYVDGPVLQKPAYRSFIGMQPIPIVYGMTLGEYANMLIGEKWLSNDAITKVNEPVSAGSFRFKVIPCHNYTHQSMYSLPARPSPNLPDMASIYWYPSTCFFEGTILSEGRGTATPFQVFGHPSLPNTLYAFTPRSTDGAKEPKLKDQLCYGWNLIGKPTDILKKVDQKIQLSYLIEAYSLFPDKNAFFLKPKSGKDTDYFFNKLAGNHELMEQIKAGKTEAEIRASWEPALSQFKTIRKKYLLYAE
ncbi:MAG: exo-beta-N-acetylmuramidase NamZ family protein [Chitinophagaceae bacterium]